MEPKKILITLGRSYLTLDLARLLRAAGHHIFIADTSSLHVTRFSNSVEKNYPVPSPRKDASGYIDALVTIVKQEKINLLIPIFEEIIYIAQHKERFPKECVLFCSSFELLHQLHHKWLFTQNLVTHGIAIPKTHLVRSQEELEQLSFTTPYALKACYSRASNHVKKVLPQGPLPQIAFEPGNPWIAQEWLEGDKFCTYSICHQGAVKAVSIYPVHYAINGNSCLTFESIHHQAIEKWIADYARKINFTGQIAFDFIELNDRQLYAIECNPRATSGLHLFSTHDQLDQAFFNTNQETLYPRMGKRKQIAIGMLMYGWKKSSHPSNGWWGFIKTLFSIDDVVFNKRDIKPILSTPLVFVSLFLESRRRKLSIPALFNYDNEWNG